MATFEPLAQVRKNFKIDWYRCPVETPKLKELTRRRDIMGWVQSLGYLILVAGTSFITFYFFSRQMWALFGVSLFVHGTIYCFNPGLITHEFSHGTVFKTRWLNGFFLRLFSILGWVNFHHYKRSHTYHHIYTLHPKGDREVVLPGNPTLNPIRLFWLFTINLPLIWRVLRDTFRLAFLGKFDREWSEAIFPDEDPKGQKDAKNWARSIIVFHVLVLVVAAVFNLWILPIVITLANFVGNWWRYFIGITMHTGLRDNVADFRKCCRTIKLDPFSKFIYWYMNYHTEHHMFAAVPCYNLGKLSKEIAWDMPKPRTLRQAWGEMREVYQKQQEDSGYQYDTPVPDNSDRKLDQTGLSASIGDLAPDSIK